MQHSDSQPAHCIFCDIMKGAAEVSVCYEDSSAVAFMDIQPVNQGHTLVVPRQHFESFQDLPPDLGMHLFEVAMRLGPVIRKVGGAEAMNLIVSSGAAAGQDVYHFHIHLIPRRTDDGFDVPLPFAGSVMPDRTVLDAQAAQILASLRDPMRPTPRVTGAIAKK
jgi:histidine triad (HIT) family protein